MTVEEGAEKVGFFCDSSAVKRECAGVLQVEPQSTTASFPWDHFFFLPFCVCLFVLFRVRRQVAHFARVASRDSKASLRAKKRVHEALSITTAL